MELTRTRPRIPASYGIATGPKGMLAWERVSEAIHDAPMYWLSTTRPDRRPHTIPIWGSWTNHRLYVEGGDDTIWASNLATNPAVSYRPELHAFWCVTPSTVLAWDMTTVESFVLTQTRWSFR